MTPDNQPALSDSMAKEMRARAEILEFLGYRDCDYIGVVIAELHAWASRLESLRRAEGATLGEGLAAEVTFAALGQVSMNVDNTYFGPHMVGVGDKVRIFKEATPTAQRVAAWDEVACECGAPERGGHAVWCPKRTPPQTASVAAGNRDRVWDAILGQLNLAYARGAAGEPAGSLEAADRIRNLLTPPPTGEAVAWMRRDAVYREGDGRSEGERIVSERKVFADDIPLYTPPAAQAEGRGNPREAVAWYVQSKFEGCRLWLSESAAKEYADHCKVGAIPLGPIAHATAPSTAMLTSLSSLLRNVVQDISNGKCTNDGWRCLTSTNLLNAACAIDSALTAPADVGGETNA